jgi:hypothetical protein
MTRTERDGALGSTPAPHLIAVDVVAVRDLGNSTTTPDKELNPL